MIEHIENVRVGDWLTVIQGPIREISNPFSMETTKQEDNRLNGRVMRIHAINPPFLLVEAEPETGSPPSPQRWTIDFRVWKLSKLTRRYVNRYRALYRPPVEG